MSQNSSGRRKVLPLLALPLVVACATPAYYFGRPWLQFHRQNVVVYDCRINSESIPQGAAYAGRISEIRVNVGQKVKAGDVVAVLDTGRLLSEIAEAESAIELAQAVLRSEEIAIQSAIEASAANLDAAEVRIEVAECRVTSVEMETRWIEKEIERSTQLVRRGSMSNTDLEEILRELQDYNGRREVANRQVVVAEHDRDAADAQVDAIKARTAELEVFRQKIAMARAELETLLALQRDATITAAVDGTVTEITRGAGSSVAMGDPIVYLKSDKVWSELRVSESQLDQIRVGHPVTVELKAYAGVAFNGRVAGYIPYESTIEQGPASTSNPVLQADARVCLKVEHDHADSRLIPGLTGLAVIERGPQPSADAVASGR